MAKKPVKIDDTYPLPAFYFEVQIGRTIEKFKEVSGLKKKLELEKIPGELGVHHTAPKKVTYDNLVLKRGIVKQDSMFYDWCKKTFNPNKANFIEPKNITISLLNESGTKVFYWVCKNAYPIEWDVAGFDSMKNEVAMETITLTYSELVSLKV